MNRYCTKCGNPIENNRKKFCDKCGAALDSKGDKGHFADKNKIVLLMKKGSMWGAWMCLFLSGALYVHEGISNISEFFRYYEQNAINNWKVHFLYIFFSVVIIIMSWLAYIIIRNKDRYLFILIVSCLALGFSAVMCCTGLFMKLLPGKEFLAFIGEMVKILFHKVGKYGCLLGVLGFVLSILSIRIKNNV